MIKWIIYISESEVKVYYFTEFIQQEIITFKMNKQMKRKIKRIEKKKKKIAAFLEVAKLNEEDRKTRKMKSKENEVESTDQCGKDVPVQKRAKIEESLLISDAATDNLHKEVNQDLGHQCPDSSKSNPNFITSDIAELRRILRERKKRLLHVPRFRLKESGELASLRMTEDHRIPLFMVDVQHLIVWSLLGHHAPFPASRWYQLIKFNKLSHTVVLAVDGISVDDLKSADGFLRLPSQACDDECDALGSTPKELFPWKLEFIGPLSYGSNLVQEIATVPLSNSQYDKVIKTYGSIEKALKGKAVYKVFRSMFPVEGECQSGNVNALEKDNDPEMEEAEGTKDKFPRTDLLLTADQMVEIGYPMPLVKASPDVAKQPLVFPNEMQEVEAKIAGSIGTLIQSSEFRKKITSTSNQLPGESDSSDDSSDLLDKQENGNIENEADEELYVFSKTSYKEVGPNSPMFAVDCEMCQTSMRRSELTRISIVNENLEVVYESLVKPHRKITNYLTRFSGITEKMLRDVKTRLKDVQEDIRKLLPPDAILVGQSLNFDLHAMKMMHPYVIDTSVVYNLSGDRSRRTKLATLSRLFLSENIQCAGPKGHDSVEDASAAMKLVLLKLSKSIHFGDAVLSDKLAIQTSKKAIRKSRQERLVQDLEIGKNGEKAYATSIFTHINRGKHEAAVIGVKGAVKDYEAYIGQEKQIKKQMGDNQHEETTPDLLAFEHSSEVIERACEIMLEHQLCILHIDQDSVGKKLKKLRKWCSKIVEHSAPCSLCIVVLGGTDKVNGACLIHLKGPSDEVT